MRAQFANGPYDHLTLFIPDGLDHLKLPVTVSTATPAVDPPRDFVCQAQYRLISRNDYVSVYQFEGISAP